MKFAAVVFALLLAGCPPRGTSAQSPAPPAPAAAGCPSGNDVYLASFLTQEDQAAAAKEGEGRTGWVLPLHDRKVDSLAGQPEYATIDAATAGSLGVPPAPPSVWLMLPGQPACKATAGAYYAAAVDGAEPNVTYGVALEGCAAPPKDQQQVAQAIALVSDQAPAGCQVVVPQPVAARLGETDAAKQWQRPTKETPIPPGLAGAVPARDCKAPGCEMLWSIAQVTVADRPVAWAGAVNWLTIPPGATAASQCDWKAETFAGFFIAGPDGNAVRITEGQDHPLLLSAVLADATGPRVLFAEGPGEYATYDLGGGAARLARHLVWLRLAGDAYAIDERIGPVCGDEARP